MKNISPISRIVTGAAVVAVACVGALAVGPAATAAPTAETATGVSAPERVPYASLEVESPGAVQSKAVPSRVGDKITLPLWVTNVGNKAFDRIELTVEASSLTTSTWAFPAGGFRLLNVEHTVTAEDLARGYFIEDVWVRGLVGGKVWAERGHRVSEFVTPVAAPAVLKAVANGKYVTAEHNGAGSLIANRSQTGLWEQFTITHNTDNTVSLKAGANGKYVTADNYGADALIANRTAVGPWEKFTLIPNADGTFSLKAMANGKYVTAEDGGASALRANRTAIGPWEKFVLTY